MSLPAELIPSAQHDPLFEGLQRGPAGLHEVVLSASAAQRLKVRKGAVLQASLSRQYQARHERVRLDLQIVDVASERAFTQPVVFASLEVLMAAEAFRDGRAVPALGWSGDPPLAEERVFPSFRLYARTIYEVARLASALTEAGQRVKPRSRPWRPSITIWRSCSGRRGRRDGGLFPVARREPVDQHRSQAREPSVLRLLAFRGGREEVQRHEKTDGLPGREVGRQHAVDDLFEEHEHRAELPEDSGEERVEAPVEHDPGATVSVEKPR